MSFGDHLKRYIYERAELEEPFSEIPQEVYKEIVVDSFKETYTPKSMNPTSTKLSALVNNWLNQASVKRENCFSSGVWVENDHRGCVGFPDKSTERTGF